MQILLLNIFNKFICKIEIIYFEKMYNLYSFEKSSKSIEGRKKSISDTTSFKTSKYEKRRESMAIKYRERIADFITTINADRSYRINDDLVDNIMFNPSNTRRAIDNKSMRSTFRTEKERIFANVANNSIYECCPCQEQNKSFELRPRVPTKEIADAKIRYKPKYLIERVKEAVERNSCLFSQDPPRSKSSISPNVHSGK